MKVTEITVHAARTFNHPYESYANFKPGVTLRATVDMEEDDLEACVKKLQHDAETFAEQQKQTILADLRTLQEQARRSARRESLRTQIKELTAELHKEEEEGDMTQLALPPHEVCASCDHGRGVHDEGHGACQVECGCEEYEAEPF